MPQSRRGPREPLEAIVAQVLNERELVITIGERAGVQEGMKFAVLAPPLEILHPKTGKPLGTVSREKVRVEAVEVQENMTVCATYRTVVIGSNLLFPNILETFGPRREIPETLRAGTKSFPPPLKPEESYIEIGDPVVQVEGEEEEEEEEEKTTPPRSSTPPQYGDQEC